MKKIRNWLSSPALPYVSAGLVVLLTLPALWTGFQLDDMAMRMALIEHPEAIAGPGEAFSFINGDLETNRQYMDLGVMPWWAAEDLRFVFLRPVTIAFHRLDYVLWPDSAPLMHLHSLLWLAALVLSVAALYRRLLSPVWIAGLATLLYAIDDAHGYPTAWLANRNALIATTLGVLALVCHDRWRRDRWRPGPWLASFYLALALFAAEFGAGTLAYLFAYVVFLEGRGEREGAGRSTRLSDQAEAGGPGRSRRFPGAPWSQRFLSLCPYAAVAAVWLIVYKVGGYGTEGSGFYVDPLRQPASFLWALFERGPVLPASGRRLHPTQGSGGAHHVAAQHGYDLARRPSADASPAEIGDGAFLDTGHADLSDTHLCNGALEPSALFHRHRWYGPAGAVPRWFDRSCRLAASGTPLALVLLGYDGPASRHSRAAGAHRPAHHDLHCAAARRAGSRRGSQLAR
jgi:hypothetical protein